MIHYLKRNQLNTLKYDACIKASINSRIYAYSWYLDIVADNWDALVLNEYEAVMPLPWRSKYLIKYIYPPAWTQQLGVFSPTTISKELVSRFLKSIPKKFKKITIQFNSGNDLSLFKTEKRVNYILKLNRSYNEIYKGFNKNRKRDLKKADKLKRVKIKNISSKEFFEFYVNKSKKYKLDNSQKQSFKKIINSQNKYTFILGVYVANKLEASVLLLEETKRITNLMPVVTSYGKENGLITLLLNQTFKKYEHSSKIFDFEGSMLLGVASFYQSFGAEMEIYKSLRFKKII
jgi:hypothetical protein